jgi:HEAT repeat protein
MCVINFFTAGSTRRAPVATNAPLATMDREIKKSLLPEFIRALQDQNPGVRNNALVALRYYREAASVAGPAVTKALQDPEIMVRSLATNVLKEIDPAAAAKAGIQ